MFRCFWNVLSCCNSLRYGLEAFMLLYSFGLSVSYMGVIGSEVNVLAQLMGGDEAISQAGWIFRPGWWDETWRIPRILLFLERVLLVQRNWDYVTQCSHCSTHHRCQRKNMGVVGVVWLYTSCYVSVVVARIKKIAGVKAQNLCYKFCFYEIIETSMKSLWWHSFPLSIFWSDLRLISSHLWPFWLFYLYHCYRTAWGSLKLEEGKDSGKGEHTLILYVAVVPRLL